MSIRQFPILGRGPIRSVPWSLVEPGRAQAMRNHGQTLERLAERGGLSPIELWSVLHGKNPFSSRDRDAVPTEAAALEWLQQHLARTLAAPADLSSAALDVLAERRRQIEREGFSPLHDDQYRVQPGMPSDLAFAASCYCTADEGEAPPAVWPWSPAWWKPKNHRANCVRAAALLLAEIERIDRQDAAG